MADASESLLQRFSVKCAKPDANGCIHWLGSKTKRGYGVILIGKVRGKNLRTTAHRAAWLLERGDLSPEILVLHKCDNPSCVNVDHLFLGSPANNTRDMVAKNRHGWRHGTPWQKLNAVDGERIRDLRAAGYSQQKIADWIGVSRPLISMVLAGKIFHSRHPIGLLRSSEHQQQFAYDQLHHQRRSVGAGKHAGLRRQGGPSVF